MRRRGRRIALNAVALGVFVVMVFPVYWMVTTAFKPGPGLKKYGVRPVHTAAEMSLLAGRFPDNIKLFVAADAGRMLAGVLVYESSHVAHAQYISATDEGKECGALDLVLTHLVNEHYAAKRYFDFGISTEDEGRLLNVGLVENKQGFGARAVVHDFYELELG